MARYSQYFGMLSVNSQAEIKKVWSVWEKKTRYYLTRNMDLETKMKLMEKYRIDPDKLSSFEALKTMTVTTIAETLGIGVVNATHLKAEVISRSTQAHTSNVAETRRRIFEPYAQGDEGPSQPTKHMKKAHEVKASCAITFFCCSSAAEMRPPENKQQYISAGLGLRRITFSDPNCDPAEFHKVIEENYPKLKEISERGYYFYHLPPGKASCFVRLVENHEDGFNPSRLQATIGGIKYIKPAQKEDVLSLAPLDIQPSPKMRRFRCANCKEEVPSAQLLDHRKACNVDSFGDDSPVDLDDPSDVKDDDLPIVRVAPRCDNLSGNSDSSSTAALYPNTTSCGTSRSQDEAPSMQLEPCWKCNAVFVDPIELIEHVESCTEMAKERKMDLHESIRHLRSTLITRNGFKDLGEAEKIFSSSRDRIWRDALRIFKKIGEKFTVIRIEFENEDGLDVGSIWREFFFLAFKHVAEHLFEGERFRLPRLTCEENEMYELGRMLSYCILFEGPTFPYLSPSAIITLITGEDGTATREEVCSSAAEQVVKQLTQCMGKICPSVPSMDCQDSPGKTSVSEFLWEHYSHILLAAGIEKSITSDNLGAVIERVIQYDAIDSRSRAFKAIRRGLAYNGVLAVIKDHLEEGSKFFTPVSSIKLAEMVLAEIEVDCPEDHRLNYLKWIKDFLEAKNNHELLEELNGSSYVSAFIRFATGAESRPVGGWNPPLKLSVQKEVTFPKSRACFNNVIMPHVETFDAFQQLLKTAVKYGDTFGDY